MCLIRAGASPPLIRAMPERKHFFSGGVPLVSRYLPLSSQPDTDHDDKLTISGRLSVGSSLPRPCLPRSLASAWPHVQVHIPNIVIIVIVFVIGRILMTLI